MTDTEAQSPWERAVLALAWKPGTARRADCPVCGYPRWTRCRVWGERLFGMCDRCFIAMALETRVGEW